MRCGEATGRTNKKGGLCQVVLRRRQVRNS